MPIVTVKYLGSFSALTRKRKEGVTIGENENVANLLNKVGQKYGRKLTESFNSGMTAF